MAVALATPPVVDWIDPEELVVDPYPTYARLRDESPVAFVPFLGGYVAASYQGCKQIEPNLESFTASSGSASMLRTMGRTSMIDTDGPEHTQQRTPINAAMRPKAIKERWTESFQENTRFYLDRLADVGPDEADLNKVFASPLATKNLMDVLSIRGVDVDIAREWSSTLMEGISNIGDDPDVWAKVDATQEQINALLADLIPYLRKNPDGTFTSALIEAGLPDEMVLANVKLAISGGINEPQHAITSIVWALTAYPEERAAVLADPALWPDVFDETLRWLSPFGLIPRKALHDVDFDGYLIPEGSTMMALIASANRDESVFPNADVVDIRRPKTSSFSFGAGPHQCAGVWLARWSIGSIAMPMLYERFEGLRNADDRDSRWFGFVARGLTEHPVSWDADRGNG